MKKYSAQQNLLHALQQAVEWPLIESGLKINLFDALVSRSSAAVIADQFGWQPEKTVLYLDALVSLGLVTKNQAGYALHDCYAPYLTRQQAGSMRETLLHLSSYRLTTAEGLLEQLQRTETADPQFAFHQADFWQRASDNLRSFHRSIASSFCADLLQKQPQWSQVKSMLDIGAGSATLAEVLTQANPGLRYHLFDLPEVAGHFQLGFDQQNQVVVHAGDYNKTALPQGFDLIYASMSLYYAHDLGQLLGQIRQALNKNGLFISLHEGLTNQRTAPRYHVTGRMLAAIRGNNVSFERGAIARALLAAGFRQVHSQTIETPFGTMELDIASSPSS